jgi:hypothetical protein
MKMVNLACFVCLLFLQTAFGQQSGLPPDYRGAHLRIPGLYVTPIEGAPFSAKVNIVSHEKLPNGSELVQTSTAHIGRQQNGRIYNELRALVPANFHGDPLLISSHIYDPAARLNIFLDFHNHLARESTFRGPPTASVETQPPQMPVSNRYYKVEEIGTQMFGEYQLQGIRKSHVYPGAISGTGSDVTVVDEYCIHQSCRST